MHEIAVLVIPALVAIPYFAWVTLPKPMDETTDWMQQHQFRDDVEYYFDPESDS
jgi:hypothetical protein